ncbi:MAG: LON peptidase substrate-binding domain-containing protein, partial [Gemmatimonadetes bacterium]|nr:LON peptidase substrate-binding domain-containing protein [Gemmatimonadota bacterium]
MALDGEEHRFSSRLPLLPLRDVVIFPGMIAPLLVGRPASVAAVDAALRRTPIFAVLTQRTPDVADPGPDDLHEIGTVVRAAQVLRVPDGTLKILVEGIGRYRVRSFVAQREHLAVDLEMVEQKRTLTSQVKALARQVAGLFQEYVELNRRIPDEVIAATTRIEDPRQLAQVVSGHLIVSLDKRQDLLAAVKTADQLGRLSRMLTEELEILRLERKIEGEVRSRVSKGQKEFYLQEQLRAIRKELGESAEDGTDAEELRARVKKAGMPEDVEGKALEEIDRLARMSPMSPEATVVRGYVETLASLPWNKRTEDRLDLDAAAKILDEDHFGLEKPKERILEYLAVVQLVKRPRGSILCFVGPPGVGKTSLGRSIARALGREFVRVALGGVRDEAEIRGHRRTYIGSMPGRI